MIPSSHQSRKAAFPPVWWRASQDLPSTTLNQTALGEPQPMRAREVALWRPGRSCRLQPPFLSPKSLSTPRSAPLSALLCILSYLLQKVGCSLKAVGFHFLPLELSKDCLDMMMPAHTSPAPKQSAAKLMVWLESLWAREV